MILDKITVQGSRCVIKYHKDFVPSPMPLKCTHNSNFAITLTGGSGNDILNVDGGGLLNIQGDGGNDQIKIGNKDEYCQGLVKS